MLSVANFSVLLNNYHNQVMTNHNDVESPCHERKITITVPETLNNLDPRATEHNVAAYFVDHDSADLEEVTQTEGNSSKLNEQKADAFLDKLINDIVGLTFHEDYQLEPHMPEDQIRTLRAWAENVTRLMFSNWQTQSEEEFKENLNQPGGIREFLKEVLRAVVAGHSVYALGFDIGEENIERKHRFHVDRRRFLLQVLTAYIEAQRAKSQMYGDPQEFTFGFLRDPEGNTVEVEVGEDILKGPYVGRLMKLLKHFYLLSMKEGVDSDALSGVLSQLLPESFSSLEDNKKSDIVKVLKPFLRAFLSGEAAMTLRVWGRRTENIEGISDLDWVTCGVETSVSQVTPHSQVEESGEKEVTLDFIKGRIVLLRKFITELLVAGVSGISPTDFHRQLETGNNIVVRHNYTPPLLKLLMCVLKEEPEFDRIADTDD